MFSSCSKDDENSLDNERDTVEFAITTYFNNKYNTSNGKRRYQPVSFSKFERSTKTLEDSELKKEFEKKYNRPGWGNYEERYKKLEESYTNITYYIEHEYKYFENDGSSITYINYFVLNKKYEILFSY